MTGPEWPSVSQFGYPTIVDGYKLAKDILASSHMTYNPSANGPGVYGEFGLLHDFNMPQRGAVYDFPFAEDTTLSGRVKRSYGEWLSGLADVCGTPADSLLVDATSMYLSNLVFWRERDRNGVTV